MNHQTESRNKTAGSTQEIVAILVGKMEGVLDQETALWEGTMNGIPMASPFVEVGVADDANVRFQIRCSLRSIIILI